MATLKPLPSFYAVYILRSLPSPIRLYIGSTPHPLRRLKQHNGVLPGGAVRTSASTRGGSGQPWEMTLLVEGFPSQIAALQFEWAAQNPHLSLHISEERRLVEKQSTVNRKGNKRPKRPRHTLPSVLSNLHLLLRVPSFARWPLNLRFFSKEVWQAWQKVEGRSPAALPGHLEILCDFPLSPTTARNPMHADPSHPVHKLDVSYKPMTEYVAKTRDVFEFEEAGTCAVCNGLLNMEEKETRPDGPLAVCPHTECSAVSHLRCLGKSFMKEEGELVPTGGECPGCGKEIRWADVVEEVTLRLRGQKEVETLLRRKKAAEKKLESENVKRVKKERKKVTASQMVPDSEEESYAGMSGSQDIWEVDEEVDGFLDLEVLDTAPSPAPKASQPMRTEMKVKAKTQTKTKRRKVGNVIEIRDTDESDSWSDAAELS